MELVTAVAGEAGEFVVGGGAASSGPCTAGPVGVWYIDGVVSEMLEFETTAGEGGEAVVGYDSWPDGVRTVVDKGEY